MADYVLPEPDSAGRTAEFRAPAPRELPSPDTQRIQDAIENLELCAAVGGFTLDVAQDVAVLVRAVRDAGEKLAGLLAFLAVLEATGQRDVLTETVREALR